MLDSLPYFLQLVKGNIILNTILTTGSFSGVDLKGHKYDSYNENSIVFREFLIGDNEVFPHVTFFGGQDPVDSNVQVMHLDFTTRDPKFYEKTAFYFGEDTSFFTHSDSLTANRRVQKKKLGFRKILDTPIPEAYITIIKNPIYGYSIKLSFYSNYIEMKKGFQEIERARRREAPNNSKLKKGY